MTDKKVGVKPHERRMPTKKGDAKKTPKEISDPQIRATQGIQRVGGGDPTAPKGEGVRVLKRDY